MENTENTYISNAPHWIWCDEQLPPNRDLVVLLVAELDHYQDPHDPNARWYIQTDFGSYCSDGDGRYGLWDTYDDWDEGQPWSVVAWMPIPDDSESSESNVKKHAVNWYNNDGHYLDPMTMLAQQPKEPFMHDISEMEYYDELRKEIHDTAVKWGFVSK